MKPFPVAVLCSVVLGAALAEFAGAQSSPAASHSAAGSPLIARPTDGEVRGSLSHVQDEGYELLDIDTLFYIDNRGVTRLLVDLNGHRFTLTTDQREVDRSTNAFPIPLTGEITINIAAYIRPGEDNIMYVTSQGPPGSEAQLIIGDLLVPGQQVAYAITDLQPLPTSFGLLQGYPNPFRDRMTLTYNIPDTRITGVHVNIAIYDLTGRRVAVLVDDVHFPGSFTVTWEPGSLMPSLPTGVYFCYMMAGTYAETVKLLWIR